MGVCLVSLRVTNVGRAVARSGLLPSTVNELLLFLSTKVSELTALMTSCAESELDDSDDFAFVLIHAAYSSTEYSRSRIQRRFLPYQLLTVEMTGPQVALRNLLFQPYQADAVNAAVLARRWISGVPMRNLEAALDIRSGVLTAMFADAANILRGLADVLYSTTSAQSAGELPTSVPAHATASLSTIIASIRRIASRLDVGLPDDVLWMRGLTLEGVPVLARGEIMLLRQAGMVSPSDLLDPGKFPQLLNAFGPRSNASLASAQSVQQATRTWRLEERDRLIESQRRRLPPECRDVLLRFYRARETEFERVLEEVWNCFGIVVEAKDDGTLTSFPDFIVSPMSQQLAVECKSKTVGEAVTFNDATDVIRKAGVNGYNSAFKVTVCQPYISPDVPRKLTNCSDLCVVNADDIAEAFVRLKCGKITQQDFADWIGRPGQALRENLVPSS